MNFDTITKCRNSIIFERIRFKIFYYFWEKKYDLEILQIMIQKNKCRKFCIFEKSNLKL